MDFKFSKDSPESSSDAVNSEKKKQRGLLVLLLILVGGFTYIYYFTDLIKPLEEQKKVEVAAPAPQAIKMPLPVRKGESAKPDVKKPEAPMPSKAAPLAPAVTAGPAAKPGAAPTKPAQDQKITATQGPAPAKPKEEPKKADIVKKTVAAMNSANVKKPVVSVNKAPSAKQTANKPASGSNTKSKTALKTDKNSNGTWSLAVGNYVLEETLSADMGRIRKAGFDPVVKPSTRKKMTMNRLFVSDYNNRVAALATLEKLKRITSDAFVIEHDGTFSVYAGSYVQYESSTSEAERLRRAGFAVTVKKADIAIPSHSLTVGPFKNKPAANSALAKLEATGIKASLLQK
jgi:cell division septation protein DedD